MRCLFFSHDGFGLGHVRRNTLIARALLAADDRATAVLVTGLPWHPPWLVHPAVRVVRVPPLLKHSRAGYRPIGMSFEEAVGQRARSFAACVRTYRPHVVVVDRHPFGTAGELREGLTLAREQGARVVLGMRDVLDEPTVVREELAGDGWVGVDELIDEVFVYGARHFVDHEAEYGLPMRPRYCGWVTEASVSAPPVRDLLAVTAGGGGDGDAVFRLALGVLERCPSWRGRFAVGPYGDKTALLAKCDASAIASRVSVTTETDGCGPLFAQASAVIQMAGYNSTFEALAAGQRAVLVPRRSPRTEQAIRAERLAALGLADVVAETADPSEVIEALNRPRRISAERLERSGIALDGAARSAAALSELAEVARA